MKKHKKMGIFLFYLLWLLNGLAALWCTGAVWFLRLPGWARWSLTAAFVLAEIALWIWSIRKKWLLAASFLLCVCVFIPWFFLLKPTGKLDWDPPFIRMPKAIFSQDEKEVKIENIRDFHYRSETDYDIRYRTETYKFDELETLDYSITHWNHQEPFGHISLSFGFKDGRHLVFSPEARLERGKLYEILPGIYRRYELIFLFGTERDIFQLRTHHRKYEHEEVLLYPTNTSPEVAAFLLKDFLKRANKLAEQPEFYNGFFYNCLSCQAPTAEKLSFNFCSGVLRGIFNGYSDRAGYRTGWLRRTKPEESFAEFRKRHSVNRFVEHLVDPPNYSQLIRTEK